MGLALESHERGVGAWDAGEGLDLVWVRVRARARVGARVGARARVRA